MVALKPRLLSPIRAEYITPAIAHRLLYPAHEMMRNKKTILPYGLPFEDLQGMANYEKSVARFARDYVWVTPDELISWGLISNDSKKRKKGEPRTMSPKNPDRLLEYGERLTEMVNKCVIGTSMDRSIIFTANPKTEAIRVPAMIPNLVFTTKGVKTVYNSGNRHLTEFIGTKIRAYIPSKKRYFMAKGSGEYRSIRKEYTNRNGVKGYYDRRTRVGTKWYYASELKTRSRTFAPIIRSDLLKDISRSNLLKDEWSKKLEKGEVTKIGTSISAGSWGARNKFLILAPLKLLDRKNYGVINHPMIADQYPHNPEQSWADEGEDSTTV